MKNIPVPVVILLVVIAIVAVIWTVRRSTGGSSVPIPTGPPSAEAMQQMRKSGAAGRDGSGGGYPNR